MNNEDTRNQLRKILEAQIREKNEEKRKSDIERKSW